MSSTTLLVTRSNAVRNPRAHINNAGFIDATRVTEAPVALPGSADACFGVPAGTNKGGVANGLTIASSWWSLPDDVESGDWLYVQLDMYVDNVVYGDTVFWADLQFRDAGHTEQDWSPWARSLQPDMEAFMHVAGMIEVAGEDATEFRVYLKVDDDRYEGAALADLYFTNVQVEKCYFRNVGIPEYADGDTEGWEWTGTAHNSESHVITPESQTCTDPVPVDVTSSIVDDTYTFAPLDDNYVLEVEFGPSVCRIISTSLGNGEVDPDGVTEVVSGGSFTIGWTANTGFTFDKLLIDGVETATSGSSYTDNNVTQHASYEVAFKITELTLAYAAGANGTISGDASQTVEYGGVGTPVWAIPTEGYKFTSWSDALGSKGRCDTNVIANLSVTASFEEGTVDEYDLTYTAGANGTIVGEATQQIPRGTSGLPVVATPSTDYHFVAWSDGKYKTATRTDSYVMGDVTAAASFAADVKRTLTYSAGAGGTLTGTATQTVLDGENGTLVTAVPNEGYRFVSWSDGRLVAPRRDLNVGGNITVTASFAAIPSYTLTYSAGTGGTISGSASQSVPEGGRGSLVTAVPNAGYRFVAWSDAKSTASRIEVGVSAAVSVTATFALANYTLRYRAIGGGTISGSVLQTVAAGSNGTEVEAVPTANYHFVIWSDGVATAARTDLAVAGNIRVYARFTIDEHALTYTAGAHGTLRGDASQLVKYGRQGMPVTAIPDAGYHFVDWSDNVTTARRMDLNVTDAITVTANFAIDT